MNELDALFARIKDDLYEPCPECNGTGVDTGSSDRCSVCDGKEFIPNHDAQAALATLRTKLAAMEAEREALLKLATLANDWLGTTAVNDYERIARWQKSFESLNKQS